MEGHPEGLERILEGLDKFREQLSQGAAQLEAAQTRLSFYQRFDEEVRRAIFEAHRLAADIKRRAEEEAAAILREARSEAEALKLDILRLSQQLERTAHEAEESRLQAEEQVRKRLAALGDEEKAVLSRLADLKEALEALADRIQEEQEQARKQAHTLFVETRARDEAGYQEQLTRLEETKRRLEDEIRELRQTRQQVAAELERSLVERLAAIRQQRLSAEPVETVVLLPSQAHPARVTIAVELLALAVGVAHLGYPRLRDDVVALPVAGESPQALLQKLQAASQGPLPFRIELKSTGELYFDLSSAAQPVQVS